MPPKSLTHTIMARKRKQQKKAKTAPKKTEKKADPEAPKSGFQNARRQMDEYGNPLSMADYNKRKQGGK